MPRPSAPRSKYSDRFAAAMAGESHFFTGVPCKRKHLANRYVTTGGCVECVSVKVVKAAKNRRPIMLEFPLFRLDDEGRVIPRAGAATGMAEYEELDPPSDEFVNAVEKWVNEQLPTLQNAWAVLQPTAKAAGITLDQFRAQGWTDAQLLEHGHAIRTLGFIRTIT